MTSRRKEYREFLKGKFWRKLTAQKKALVGCCERCRSNKRLQSHHVRYPAKWEDTTLSDLIVLCRRCHAKEHGIKLVPWVPFHIHRGDWTFSAFVYRCGCLKMKLGQNRPLRKRDRAFLKKALRMYPPEPKDTAMQFQVQEVRRWDKMQRSGVLAYDKNQRIEL